MQGRTWPLAQGGQGPNNSSLPDERTQDRIM